MTELPATPAEVWAARLQRAQQQAGPSLWIGIHHELLDVLGDVDEERRLWTEMGEVLGIGPPAEDWFDREPDEPELAAGPMPRRPEYRHEQR